MRLRDEDVARFVESNQGLTRDGRHRFPLVFSLLHEIGHIKMLDLLRLPHSSVNVEVHEYSTRIVVVMCIQGQYRNGLDRFLVDLAGALYPILYRLKQPGRNLKFTIPWIIHSFANMHEEHTSPFL